ncbi:MAG: glycosyltransferase family 9 protein [Rhodospirillales bacterium]|nr:glycosyltransferase family 9 protein [Rhodospirillales bacterium]
MTLAAPSGILVIKLGALGDFVQALGPFAAIRNHHKGQRITLLTTGPFEEFARASGYFDDTWTGGRPATADVGGWLKLRRRLRAGEFERVYDLQTSDRSSFCYRLFWPGPRPEWSGIAVGCSHPHANPKRDFMHTVERQTEQLAMAGISNVPAPDLSWVAADISRFGLPKTYALLAPGGAIHRPGKQWPPERFGDLAQRLAGQGIAPVLLGSKAEAPIMAAVAKRCSDARDLSGQTSLLELAALSKGARLAVGNDTGPMHLTAQMGCPSVVLYSGVSDPALCGQRGRAVTIIRREKLSDLTKDDVLGELGL